MDNRTLDAILNNFEGIVGFLTFVAMAIYWLYGLVAKTKKGHEQPQDEDAEADDEYPEDEYVDNAPPTPPPVLEKTVRKAIPADAEWQAAIARRERRAAGAKPTAALPKVGQTPSSACFTLPVVSLSAEQIRNGFIWAEILAPPISMRATGGRNAPLQRLE